MSLNWEFKDKEKFAAIKGDKLNDCFVWGCMFVSMNSITEANAKEWHDRYVLYDMVAGPFYYKGTGDDRERWVPTLEDVQKRIGLQTNVSTESKSKFLTKVWKSHQENEAKKLQKQ